MASRQLGTAGAYSKHHSKGGKLLARFDTLYLTGWAPHDSQQHPLKPLA